MFGFRPPPLAPDVPEGPRGRLYPIPALYGLIFIKLCMEVAYWPPLMICYMAFTIECQTKAAAAFKGSFGIYEPILIKLYVHVAYWSPLITCYVPFAIKSQTKATAAFKGSFAI